MHLATAQTGEECRTEQSSPPEWFTVLPEEVPAVWPALEPHVARALKRTQSPVKPIHYVGRILIGDSKLWACVANGEVVAGCIWHMKSDDVMRKVVWIDMLVGVDMEFWYESGMAAMERMKEMAGAESIEAQCRPGLARKLQGMGWSQRAVVMRKNDGR